MCAQGVLFSALSICSGCSVFRPLQGAQCKRLLRLFASMLLTNIFFIIAWITSLCCWLGDAVYSCCMSLSPSICLPAGVYYYAVYLHRSYCPHPLCLAPSNVTKPCWEAWPTGTQSNHLHVHSIPLQSPCHVSCCSFVGSHVCTRTTPLAIVSTYISVFATPHSTFHAQPTHLPLHHSSHA